MSNEGIEDEQLIAEERMAHDVSNEILHGSLQSLESLQPVVALCPTTTVADAVAEMIERRVGCVVVTDQGKLVGIFSERDVLTRIVAPGLKPSDVTLSKVMTENPETLTYDNEIVFALNKMTVGGFRHVPIVDDEGNPAAVVSMRDIVAHLVSFHADVVYNLPDNPVFPSTRDGG